MIIRNITQKAVLLLGLVLVSTTLLAQGGQKHPAAPSHPSLSQMVEELTTSLNLSADQKSQISLLFKSHFEEMDKLMGQKHQEDRQKMGGYRKDFEAKVKAVLTAEQAQAFEVFQKSHGPQSDQPRPKRK